MRVGRGLDSTDQQMEKSAGIRLAGSMMQVVGRSGGVKGRNASVWVR